MNVLRWIFSHLFLVMVLIILAYGWFIREDLADWYRGGDRQSVELEATTEVAPVVTQGRQEAAERRARESVEALREEARSVRQDAPSVVPTERSTRERAPTQPAEPAGVEQTETVSLQQARTAFWQGEHERAIELYQALIAQGKATPELHGELGNILGWVGRMDEALDALEQAAEGLLAEQRFAEVVAMLPAIHTHRPQLAERLHQRLLEARRKAVQPSVD